LVSCDKTEEPENEPTVYLPTISLVLPDTNEIVVGQGESFLLSVTATANPTSNSALTRLQIMRNYNYVGYEVFFDSTINTNLFVLENFNCISNTGIGVEDWKIVITDESGGSDSVMFSSKVLDLNPILSFRGGEYQPGMNRIVIDTALYVGEQFVFGVIAEAASVENIDRILVERNFENVSLLTLFDSTTNESFFTRDILTFSFPNPGNEEFIFTAWDKKNRQSSISFTITTIPLASDITTYQNIFLGAQSSTIGNSFASENGTVYTLVEAKNNSEKIDLMYFFGATNLASLAAPNDPDAAMVYNNPQNGLQTWDILNNTKFRMTDLSSDDFNSIVSSYHLVIAANTPTGPDQSKINNLSAGNVLAFFTSDEKYGLIRIDNIMSAEDGTIEITVKVQ